MEVCRDGDAALRHVLHSETQRCKPDLIILDLNLSRLGGLDVLKEIRTRRIFDQTPVAMLTSSLSPSQRNQAIQMKADAFLSKPIHLDEFLSQVGGALAELLNRNPAGDACETETP